ncbi:MAG TPA: hypothetical protein VFG69_03100 [Nannocystaceae bacterium]|nr:hypothetical protein [Nannocystaceae bacterium]
MSRSPWDGGDRRALFAAIAIVGAWDIVGLAIDLLGRPDEPVHPGAPRWLLAFADAPVLVLAVALVGLAALAASLRERRRLPAFVVAIASSALLVEALAAASDGPWRARFFVGAALLGAVLAEGWARGASVDIRARAAERGALAMLAATWFGAGLSKIAGAGESWADATTMRAIAAAHAHIDAPGLAQLVIDAPTLARSLALAAVLTQLAAPALLAGPRWRTLAALGLVAFHLGVALVTRIGYWQPVALLLAFALPWPRWIPALRRVSPESTGHASGGPSRVRLAIVLATIVGIAWWPGVRAYTELHHRPRSLDDAGLVVARHGIAAFGPLVPGALLVDGWRIAALQREDESVVAVIEHERGARAVLRVSPRDRARAPSPFDGEHVAVAYGEASVPLTAFAAAAHELSRRLDAAAARGELVW